MSVDTVLATIVKKMNEKPEHLEGVTYTYEFRLSGEEEQVYQLKIHNQTAEYAAYRQWEPRLTLELDEANFKKLASDRLNPTMAYMNGKLKVHGELTHALKFHSLLKKYT
ncbi:SCP2 sterol-binding domain-containing protein [Salipaludibacillus sp. LMS25]|uniref:SCP2 sterol-binding domain-containing protein n=1 Tax=Salipaludibacillus sp. LMS25 TaxID=2924031 RepID=UPI0020D1DBF8|nr:SCP2 sterol-binding domain-containing protein [Salipaludibacillus sp. LMS25]UTR13961.1 SCP2 sterol-binding domain-containing protein [Salipaludibacillus sp. LMS25]